MFWAFRKFVPGMQELFRAPPPQSPPLPPSPAPISAPNIDRGPPPPIPPRPAHLQQQFNTPIVQPDTVHHAHGPPPPLPPPPPPSMLTVTSGMSAVPPPGPSPCPQYYSERVSSLFSQMLNAHSSRTPTSKLLECPHLASHWNIHPSGTGIYNAAPHYGTGQPQQPAHFPGQPLFPGPAHSNFCPCAVKLNQDQTHFSSQFNQLFPLPPTATTAQPQGYFPGALTVPMYAPWMPAGHTTPGYPQEWLPLMYPTVYGLPTGENVVQHIPPPPSTAPTDPHAVFTAPQAITAQHPVISHFLAYTKGSTDAMQVSQWTNSFGLVLYPELEEIVSGVVMRIFNRFGLQGLPEPEQKRPQHELEEPLDLSGSFLAELISRRVVFAGGQNDAALTAMWKASTMASNCKPEQLEKKFALFKRRHTTYIDLHPPAFLRLLAGGGTTSASTAIIHSHV
ncbi:hypothetical protein GGX14DRAFT_401671 [Mycena pura]|uniref:Uncharacterized protein n=1 Tax=Mycena pura TaxID=153505 RepID=A0AAD6V0H0_9AGAR|nr:hypothetical protein GGX14DRAFT_401671 [Mycena pura]